MPRFSANLGFLFTEVPFLERFGEAAHAGFRAVEFPFIPDIQVREMAAEVKRHKLDVVLNLARIRPIRFPPPPDLLTAAAQRTRKTPAWAYALFVVVLLAAAIVAYFVMHRL